MLDMHDHLLPQQVASQYVKVFMDTHRHNGCSEQSESIAAVFQLAHDELLCLLDQHKKLTARIAAVKKSLMALADLFGDHLLTGDRVNRKVLAKLRPQPKLQSKNGIGLTSAIRRVLSDSKTQLTTSEVYELLLSQSPESVQHHKSPTSSITTTLKRLAIAGEVIESRDGHNVRLWESKSTGRALATHV